MNFWTALFFSLFFSVLCEADVIIEPDEQQLVRVTSDYYENEFTDIRVWAPLDANLHPTIKGFRIKDYSIEALQTPRIFAPFRSRSVRLEDITPKGVPLRTESFIGIKVHVAILKLKQDFESQLGGNFVIQLMSHAPSRFFDLPLFLSLNLSTRTQWKAEYFTNHIPLEVVAAEVETRYSLGLPVGLKKVNLQNSFGRTYGINVP